METISVIVSFSSSITDVEATRGDDVGGSGGDDSGGVFSIFVMFDDV